MIAAGWVSSKSMPCASIPFANAAEGAELRVPNPHSVAAPSLYSEAILAPAVAVPTAADAMLTPMVSSMHRNAACTAESDTRAAGKPSSKSTSRSVNEPSEWFVGKSDFAAMGCSTVR
jgi:hypothetical protein